MARNKLDKLNDYDYPKSKTFSNETNKLIFVFQIEWYSRLERVMVKVIWPILVNACAICIFIGDVDLMFTHMLSMDSVILYVENCEKDQRDFHILIS